MAFKAHHLDPIQQLDLKPEEIEQSFFNVLCVFFIQIFMIIFLGQIIFGFADGPPLNITFDIGIPASMTVLGSRFICTILMHLQVESDVRQGIRMMKYNCNHRSEFVAPNTAFVIGLMQTVGGLAAEVFCILYLVSIQNPVDVIIRFVALASIAKVDDFYASALPSGNRIKQDTDAFTITVHRKDIMLGVKGKEFDQGMAFKLTRFVYKAVRMLYCSFLFYFFPYLVLLIPYGSIATKV